MLVACVSCSLYMSGDGVKSGREGEGLVERGGRGNNLFERGRGEEE